MKFNFPYEKLLHHRKNLEDIAHKNFIEAQRAYDEQQALLNSYYSSIDEARLHAAELEKNGGNQAESLVQIHEFIKGQELRIERQRLKMREFLQKVEETQEILREAAIEYKIIEKLKDKRHEEFKTEIRKRDQKAMDEVATQRYKRGLQG